MTSISIQEVESAEQKPPQKTNAGVRRLLVRLDAPNKGPVHLAVLLAPLPDAAAPPEPPALKPLELW